MNAMKSGDSVSSPQNHEDHHQGLGWEAAEQQKDHAASRDEGARDMTPKAMSRASHGGGLLQNFMQSEGKASLGTRASRSGRPNFSIRWGKASERTMKHGGKEDKEQVPALSPSRPPARGLQGRGRSLRDGLGHS